MNTDDSESDDEKKSDDEALLPQVVDYYKKFAQNTRLPSYFRGNKIDEYIEKDAETLRNESPGSSVASKSKLEWDNGADIGYENVEVAPPPASCESGGSGSDKVSGGFVDVDAEKRVVSVKDSLKRRIGIPMAESTPVAAAAENLQYVETPVLRRKYDAAAGDAKFRKKRSNSYEDLSSSRSEKTLKKWSSQQNLESDPECVVTALKRIINLRPTKPTIIECISKRAKKDKNTQTSLTQNASAAVQTDLIANNNSNVIYSQHSDSAENKTSEATQTDSEACISKCNSFEYLCVEEKSILKRTEAKTNLAESGQGDGSGSGGGDVVGGDAGSGRGSSSGGSSAVLGEAITRKHSRDLINDIDRTIALIEKLTNSKRFDDNTKRYYLKKIVEKIINNCYSEDESNGKRMERNQEDEQYLQGNIPWKPVDSTKKTELKTQTFVEEFVPEKTKKKSPFTLCHTTPPQPTKNNVRSSSGDAPISITTDTYYSSTTDDWRASKTLSERRFEEQRKSSSSDGVKHDGDNLVNFAKKERQSQLTWIRNEIVHLNKLKKLLEDRKTTKDLASNVLKPHIEDLTKRKKSTTVYMITTEQSEDSNNSQFSESLRMSNNSQAFDSIRTSNNSDSLRMSSNCKCGTIDNNSNNHHHYHHPPPPNKPIIKHCKCTPAALRHRPCTCITKSAPIDLRNARLVSNEVFTTNTAKGRTTTSVSRYCFEIPLDKKGVVLKSVNNVQFGNKPPCKCCAAQAGTCLRQLERGSQVVVNQRTDAGVVANPTASDFEIQTDRNSAQMKDEELRTDDLQTQDDKKTCSSCGCSNPKQVVVKRCSCTQTSKHGGSTSSKSSYTSAGSAADSCVIIKDRKQKSVGCQCVLPETETCKCKECASQCNAQREDAEKILSSKEKRSSSVGVGKRATSTDSAIQHKSTASVDSASQYADAKTSSGLLKTTSSADKRKTSTNSAVQHNGLPKKPETIDSSNSSTSVSSSSSSSSSSDEFRLCPCCRLNKVALPSARGVSDSKPAPNYILCYPCYQQCEQTTKPGSRPYYTYPGHVCNCYTVLKTSALDQIRQTIHDLEKIDVQEDYCKCVLQKTSNKKNKDYCDYCNCKLQKVRKGRKGGIAYTLTIEGTPPKAADSPKGVKQLPEIKIKIPDIRSRKKRKDKENEDRARGSKSKHHSRSSPPAMTLQEYLSMNNPGFVQSAEERRKCLLQLAVMREERCDKYKQLLALTSGMQQNDDGAADCYNNYKEKKLFTTKEMKAITAKHYKKLPEVQQKMIDNKERQIKLANRLLADMFNKKVRECALKGKTNLSTSYSVIKFA